MILPGILLLAVGFLTVALLAQRKRARLALTDRERRLCATHERLDCIVADQEKTREALEFSRRRLGLLAQVTASVVGASPLTDEGRKLAEGVMAAFDADGCVIHTLEGANLLFLASAGIREEAIPPRLPATWGGFREILSTMRPAFFPASAGRVVMMPFANSAGAPRFVSHAAAPMRVQSQTVGIVSIYSRAETKVFSATDLEHLQIVADQVASAIVNDRLFREVRSQKDELAQQMTVRKRAEDALRQSEERFRTAAEFFPYIFVIYDAQRRLRFINARGLQLAGRSLESLVGRQDEDWAPAEFTRHYLPALKRAVETRAHQMVECAVSLPSGVLTLVAHFVPLLDDHGRIRQVLGIAHDITERKRAEESLKQSEGLFRAISEQSMVGICIMQEGKFSYVNPRFAEIHGYTQSEMLLLPSVFDIVADEDRELVVEKMYQRLASNTPGMHYRAHGRRKDGRTITVEIHGIRTDLNGKGAVIGTLQDITERERDEAALKRTTEQLQALSKRLLETQETERRHIARELHDEIGQALTALKINLQALERSAGPDGESVRFADSITIVDRTLRQVRDLSLDLRPSMLDDLGLNAALRWYADQQAQRTGLQIQFRAQPIEGRLEPAQETACFRVAQEALTNVIRHAQATEVEIEMAHQDGFLHLTVRDNGIGFDLDAVRHEVVRGASMGLLGMEERVLLSGGNIEFISMPQRGTEVHAWFPLANPTRASSGSNLMAK